MRTLSRPKPAGTRNTKVTVERLKTTNVPEAGGHVPQHDDSRWEIARDIGTDGSLWAGVVPSGSREFFRGQQVSGELTHEVTVLYGPGRKITEHMRLKLETDGRTRILDIAEPPRNVDEERHSLVFACIEQREGSLA